MKTVHGLVGPRERIPSLSESVERFLANVIEFLLEQARHVLQTEGLWLELFNHSNKMQKQVVALVTLFALSPSGETLTRRAADQCIDPARPRDTGVEPPKAALGSCHHINRQKLRGVTTYDLTLRKVEGMSSGMNGIVFHSSDHIIACLFKPETHSACAGEKIYCDGPRRTRSASG
ncbi:hypothetical protein QCD70_15525 [Agreia sp. PsM10]|nr:hypothetical protein [Agreia sp. PsM10]MDN4641662.1 hypothetical protein [Agreia sp. PsM10]